MTTLQDEAKNYDLSSLIALQNKRRENILLFEKSIRNERNLSMLEASAQSTLEDKIQMYNKRQIKLSKEDVIVMRLDIPKLISTIERRKQTISLLQVAIINEQESMDREAQMISFLETQNVIQK